MIRDLLRGERCPSCHIATEHPEAKIERVSVDELLTQDPAGVSYRLIRVWVQCSVCGHLWAIVACADRVDVNQLAAWLRCHPVRLLPEDAPR